MEEGLVLWRRACGGGPVEEGLWRRAWSSGGGPLEEGLLSVLSYLLSPLALRDLTEAEEASVVSFQIKSKVWCSVAA